MAISFSTNYTNRADRGEEEKFKQSDCITSVGLKITPHGADLRGSPLVTCVLQLNLEWWNCEIASHKAVQIKGKSEISISIWTKIIRRMF